MYNIHSPESGLNELPFSVHACRGALLHIQDQGHPTRQIEQILCSSNPKDQGCTPIFLIHLNLLQCI